MGIFDAATGIFDKGAEALDKGVVAARGAVAGAAVEKTPVMRAFSSMCTQAHNQGWHERNGGNLTYLLSDEQVGQIRQFFYTTPGTWVQLEPGVLGLGGRFAVTTATGVHLRNVADTLVESTGIVELSPTGNAWRMVWGFKDGALPTSELGMHLACLAARHAAGATDACVAYHAHPAHLVALTALEPLEDRSFTRALWKALAECVIVAPRGVAVLGWQVPGTPELAQACAGALSRTDVVVMAQHGVFCCCASFDDAFGLVHTLDKAAQIRLIARAANAGNASFPNQIPDAGLRDIAARYLLPVNEDFLD